MRRSRGTGRRDQMKPVTPVSGAKRSAGLSVISDFTFPTPPWPHSSFCSSSSPSRSSSRASPRLRADRALEGDGPVPGPVHHHGHWLYDRRGRPHRQLPGAPPHRPGAHAHRECGPRHGRLDDRPVVHQHWHGGGGAPARSDSGRGAWGAGLSCPEQPGGPLSLDPDRVGCSTGW